MLKSLALYLAKKYAVSAIQDAVKAKKPEVASIAVKVASYAQKAAAVVGFLNALALRLSDGELTDQEAADTICEAKDIADELTK